MQFLSTPSARRATGSHKSHLTKNPYFYPRPPRGGRRRKVDGHFHAVKFLSTPSARRATAALWRSAADARDFYPRPPRGGRRSSGSHCSSFRQYFYPRPPRGGRRRRRRTGAVQRKISIHALREEGDLAFHIINNAFFDFYPRPPRGGRRGSITGLNFNDEFLSTPSARRATAAAAAASASYSHFYPRPPRGGRRTKFLILLDILKFLSTPSARRATSSKQTVKSTASVISIHALREEGDFRGFRLPPSSFPFLSTPSARRATRVYPSQRRRPQDFYPRPPRGGRLFRRASKAFQKLISIHALREEGDKASTILSVSSVGFLSTPSARRATWHRSCSYLPTVISIHALREEGDPSRARATSPSRYFYPRPPRGGRLSFADGAHLLHGISIHALREEGDSKNRDKISIFKQIIQHSARI